MTKDKLKQFNIRIKESLYNQIKHEAEAQDQTMTEYVISKLTNASTQIDNSYTDDYIKQLEARIQQQEEYIQNDRKHIQELTRLLDQQQQLQLTTQTKNEQLQIELKEVQTADNKKWYQFWK